MKRVIAVIAVLALAAAGAVLVRDRLHHDEDPFVIIHWANSHPMRKGLLPDMAAEFNKGHHHSTNGQPIKVVVISCDSATQIKDLAARVQTAGRAEEGCRDKDGNPAGDPTIITPQSGDWLIDLNATVGGPVVDVSAARHIAETWLGIVTYRDMAECLRESDPQIGYADIIALKQDPNGWASLDCSELAWGKTPKLAFTNPSTSTSGRNVLVSLYSIAADKPPAELTMADVQDPDVVDYVKDFQGLVDHYMSGTIPMNTKIRQGRGYGHFFLMPEDNLVSLCLGNEKAVGSDGTVGTLEPVTDMVMIYPTEGSVLNSNPAAVVTAPWVTDEHRQAADQWIDFLLDEDQQQTFTKSGFRPPADTGVDVDAETFSTCGLSAEPPTVTIEPGDLQPDVLHQIIDSWGAVKKPSIVTFVVDTSGSMEGEKLDHVKAGLLKLLDAMSVANSPDDQVGLVTFSSGVEVTLRPRPLNDARFDIASAVDEMAAEGFTALYDAIKEAIKLTDEADGDEGATRAVVVLSDGAATSGTQRLDDLISMSTVDESRVMYSGFDGDQPTANGQVISIDDVQGEKLIVVTVNDIQIFFVGFDAADVNGGRLLADATGAEYRGSEIDDLATVIEQLSGYF